MGFAVEVFHPLRVKDTEGQPWVRVVPLDWVGETGSLLGPFEFGEKQAFVG